jgi:hypothetical protein
MPCPTDVENELFAAFALTEVDVVTKRRHCAGRRCVNTPAGGVRLFYRTQLSLHRFEQSDEVNLRGALP